MLNGAADGDRSNDDEERGKGTLEAGSSHRVAATVVALGVVLGAHALVRLVTMTNSLAARNI